MDQERYDELNRLLRESGDGFIPFNRGDLHDEIKVHNEGSKNKGDDNAEEK